ncbi:MAG: S41 family peptidase [Planctomycetaceae bacterium]|jgi:carboxyl-terminal processing protease|nr:S41 family peptidase [Planctomycetaceae bacterium]
MYRFSFTTPMFHPSDTGRIFRMFCCGVGIVLLALFGTTATAQSPGLPAPTAKPDVIPFVPQEIAPFPSSPPGNGGISGSGQQILNVPERLRVNPFTAENVPLREVPLPPPLDSEELQKVLQDGLTMEHDARWADVLNHYETALRIYRNDDALVERYRLARFHYDIGRRSKDNSYVASVRNSKLLDTLGFYEEIITLIQRDYVDLPHWDQLFRCGIQDAAIALADDLYRKRIGLDIPAAKVNAYLNTMQQTADGWLIRDREDMKNGILRLAEIAQDQIGFNPSAMLMEFTCGVVNSLDPYSAYLTPNQLRDQFSLINGNLVGLGVELRSDRESLIIVRVIQGSPAQECGLLDGDRILAVNGTSTKGRDTDSAADLLQGVEGTQAKLLIQSNGQTRNMSIARRQIEVPSVENVKMLNSYLGYVKLTGFQSKTCDEMQAALTALQQQGMQCLILDMRHNPGGLLKIGVKVANLFIKDGAIVRTRGRNNQNDFPYMATGENTWSVPLLVLIDEESASAAEIVAGAIRDHKRGIIVGKRSYGKGTIQQILSVTAGNPPNVRAGLRLTVEKFYSPKGLPYSGIGVSPDVPVDGGKHPYFTARPIDGQVKVPQFQPVSSDLNDPFIRQALAEAQKIVRVPNISAVN